MLEKVKQEMEEKGSSMTDGGKYMPSSVGLPFTKKSSVHSWPQIKEKYRNEGLVQKMK